nr:OR16 protein [Callosobruchus chinensis]
MTTKRSKNLFEYQDVIFVLNGVPLHSVSYFKRVIITLWGVVLLAFCTCFYYLEAMMMKNNVKELSVFFQQIGILISALVDILKLLAIAMHWKRLFSIRLRLESDEFQYEPYGSFQPDQLLSNSNKFCKRLTAFMLCYYMTAFSSHYSALSRLNLEQSDYYFQDNSSCYDYLPYYYHIPFDTNTIRRCEYALIGMDIGMCIYIGYTLVYDNLFFALIIYLQTYLQILAEATKYIRERTLESLKLPADYDMFRDDENPALEKATYYEIRKCCRNLLFLLRIQEDIETVSTYITMSQTISTLLTLATNLYTLSMTSPSDADFLGLLVYILLGILQMTMICHFGYSVTETVSMSSIALHETFVIKRCSWISDSNNFGLYNANCKTFRITVSFLVPLSNNFTYSK